MDYQSQYLEQVMNEITYDKNQLMDNLEKYYRGLLGDSKNISPFIYKILSYLAIYKRLDNSVLAGLFYKGNEINAKKAIAYANGMAKLGLLIKEVSNDKVTYIVALEVPSEEKVRLDKLAYPLPMLVPPKKLGRTDGSIMGFRKRIMCRHGFNTGDHCLGTIDKANSVALAIEPRVSQKCAFRRKNGMIDALRDKEAKDTENYMITSGNKFWLLHEPDFRGRIYDRGYHIKAQGIEYQKGVLALANKEYIED
jgi:hypothetical protein